MPLFLGRPRNHTACTNVRMASSETSISTPVGSDERRKAITTISSVGGQVASYSKRMAALR